MPVELARLEAVFSEAVRLEAPDERARFLDRACGDDTELRQQVERLLAAHDTAGTFMAPPPHSAPTVDLPASIQEKTGSQIGRYKLLEQIGEGGFGVVFMAEQEHPVRRRVALKIVKLGMDTRQVVARFEAERQALAMMDHPGVAKVLDGGATESGRPYFVMELVKGTPITEYCDRNKLSIPRRLELFGQVCQAVQHAHQKGLIHRDIKPTNILVSTQDDRPAAKVIDFGIAKAMQARLTEKTLFTEFRQLIGTPEYMSPEQADGGLDVDTRSDVYSLGVLLYELLAGSTPFDPKELRSNAYAEMQRIIREVEPPAPSTRLSTMKDSLPSVADHRAIEPRKLEALVRGELDWIVMRCLEKDRMRRYPTAIALAEDVQHYLTDQPVQARSPTPMYRLKKFIHRNKLPVAAAAALALALTLGVIGTSWQSIRATRAQRQAHSNEVLANDQKKLAEQLAAKAEGEARRAELQVAEGLIHQGDALVSAADFPAAYARYAEAAKQLERLGSPLARLDLSLVRLYRASPPPLWSIKLRGEYIGAFTVLPSRKEVIASCGDAKLYVYDLLTGAEIRSFASARNIRHIVGATSLDGPVIIASSADSVRVIDPSSGAVLREAEDDRAAEFCVISPDGALAASGNFSGTVTFWETATLRKLGTGKHGAQINDAAFSHDGALVATASEENTIALWDPRTAREVRRFPARQGHSRVAFGVNDRFLVCGEIEGAISAVSLDGKFLATWPAHRGGHSIRSVIPTPEGKRVISAGEDGRVRVFDNSQSGAWEPILTMHPADQARIFGAVYVPDAGPKVCAATNGLPATDQGVLIAFTEHAQVLAWPLLGPHRFTERLEAGLSMSSDGLLCAGQTLGRVELRDAASGRTLCLLPGSWSRTTTFSPDGGFLYVGRDDGTLGALDVRRGEYLWSVQAHDAQNCSVEVASDGALLVSAGEAGGTRIWDTRTGALLRGLSHPGGYGTAAIFAPPGSNSSSPPAATTGTSLRGRRLLIGGADQGIVYDWDLAGDSPPKRVYAAGAIRGLTLSPDGKLLAVATVAHRATLLDSATLQNVGILGPIRSPVYQVRFISLDTGPGAWALACAGRELRAFDMSTRQEQLVLDSTFDERAITNTDTRAYRINAMATSGDGTVVMAMGTGRIDLTLPRRYRDLQRDASPVARAEWYARWGLWAWTRELLQREKEAGREVPPLLGARANWMCGDYESARRAFDLAVARHEVPAWYAALCLSVGDTPPTVAPRPPDARPPDPGERAPTTVPLPEGVLAAADVPALKALMGQDVVIEGIVADSVWSRSGKVMNIQFAGAERSKKGISCVVFLSRRPAFDAAFGGDAASAFSGSRLRVRGKLVVYGGFDRTLAGSPQIILEDPQQVSIVQSHPATRP